MKGYRRFWAILLISGLSFFEFASSHCSKDTDCRYPGEICCTRDFTCSTKQRCNSHSCIIDSHCPAGEKCEHSKCIMKSYGTETCYSDKDCYNNFTTKQKLRCCEGKCKDIFRCAVFTTTKPTTSTLPGSPCISWRDCRSGDQCKEGKCKKGSDVLLTKAGFLSAAILTGSVFLLILCCCFVRESRYSRQRYVERQRRRSRQRSRSRQSRRRSTHHSTSAVENTAFSTEDINNREGGFFVPPPEYPTESTTPGDTQSEFPQSSQLGEQSSSPPPYYTLSFELPPSYEEALQSEQNRGALAEVA